ncbi:hypothetical protein Pcinc_041666 [Petrolisthes cinctipes]|uniref:PNK FHA domain-containing protein n=1 Tax=Petrolisthes cinctipes TaxID=88211 RepID=A0AAE1BKA4_PETCI|nr:hypothetical protein Pcinc_041666 [Petrolisthes cinctipes]
MAGKCWLTCLANLHPRIHLPNRQTCTIGRSRDTKIKSKRCSKSQVEVLADYTTYTLTVHQVGPNASGVNGTSLLYGNTAQLKHNDILEILQGEYHHRIEFEPPPPPPVPKEDNQTNPTTTVNSEMPRRKANTDLKRKSPDSEERDTGRTKRAKEQKGVPGWEEYDNGDLLVLNKDMEGRAKIACYDVDGTLITTKSGKVFAVGYDDWKILFSEVPGKLKQLHKDGFKIVIFTNQAGIAAGKHTVEGIQKKLSAIFDKLGVPVQAFVSTGKGSYRKPALGMWDFFKDKANGGVTVDMKESVYVGDAAGRPAEGKKKKKDFSKSDRLFALNADLNFFTPEEHFLGYKTQAFEMPEFDPRDVDDSLPMFDPSSTKVPKHKVEVVVCVGYPGSGKSFLASTYFTDHGYIQANRDLLGSWQKCISAMEKSLQDGHHVIIDNTNPDAESRKRYIDAAKKFKVPVRCFVFNLTKDHCRHNNKYREFSGTDHSKVSDMVYNMYKSRYEEPSLKEGFDDIVKVNFIPNFRKKKDEDLYKMFLLEK